MARKPSAIDMHLRLLAEKASDALERLDAAREFAIRARAIDRDRSNSLSYSVRGV